MSTGQRAGREEAFIQGAEFWPKQSRARRHDDDVIRYVRDYVTCMSLRMRTYVKCVSPKPSQAIKQSTSRLPIAIGLAGAVDC